MRQHSSPPTMRTILAAAHHTQDTSAVELAPALTLRAYSVTIGIRQLLEPVHLQLRPGCALLLHGPPGCGKSTLLRSIMGLHSNQTGAHVGPVVPGRTSASSLILHGVAIDNMSPEQRARHGLGYVAQQRDICGELSLLENLWLGQRALHLRRSRACAALQLADIWQLLPELKSKQHLRADQLSGGQQQLLAILRCLLSAPSVLLLDEIGEGLAQNWLQLVLQLLRIVKSQGGSILFTASNAPLLHDFSDAQLELTAL